MKVFAQLLFVLLVIACFLTTTAQASENTISYYGKDILVSTAKIENFGIKAEPRMYVFSNKYGVYAVLDVDGDFYLRERFFPKDGKVLKITVSQKESNRVRISIKLDKLYKLKVKYLKNEGIIKISFKDPKLVPLLKPKAGLKRKSKRQNLENTTVKKVKQSVTLPEELSETLVKDLSSYFEILAAKDKLFLFGKGVSPVSDRELHGISGADPVDLKNQDLGQGLGARLEMNKAMIVPLLKSKSGLKKKEEKKKIKKISAKIVKPAMVIPKELSREVAEDPFFAFYAPGDEDDLPPLDESLGSVTDSELYNISGIASVYLNDQDQGLKVILKKSGLIKKTKSSYKIETRLKATAEALDLDIRNLYLDGEFDDKTSFRFGFDNGALAGESVTYFNGIEAFFPKDVDNLFLSDIESARITVPELMFSYTLDDATTIELLWQLRHIEHDLGDISLFENNMEYNLENEKYSYFKDSNIILGFNKMFKESGFDLSFFYRYGYDLFPVYEIEFLENEGLVARQKQDRFHTLMATIAKTYDNLSLNAELVWSIDKPRMNSLGKCERAASLDIVSGIGYTFPLVDTKLQLGGSFEEENNANIALWLKPNKFLGLDLQLTLAYNIDDQASAQVGLSRRVTDNFEVGADFSVIKNPQNEVAKRLGERAKLEFKYYF